MTNTTITPAEAKALREKLSLSQDEMAQAVRLNGGRAIRKQEAGEHKLSGPQTLCLDYIMEYGVLPERTIKKNRRRLKKLVDTKAETAYCNYINNRRVKCQNAKNATI